MRYSKWFRTQYRARKLSTSANFDPATMWNRAQIQPSSETIEPSANFQPTPQHTSSVLPKLNSKYNPEQDYTTTFDSPQLLSPSSNLKPHDSASFCNPLMPVHANGVVSWDDIIPQKSSHINPHSKMGSTQGLSKITKPAQTTAQSRTKSLEKNRLSAKKFRAKEKAKIERLKYDERKETDYNARLKNQVERMTKEVNQLIATLQFHVNYEYCKYAWRVGPTLAEVGPQTWDITYTTDLRISWPFPCLVNSDVKASNEV